MRRLEELLQRFLPIGVLIVAVAFVPAMVLAPTGLRRLRALEKELAEVDGENQDVRREIARLQRQVQHLRDDPAAIERIARDELGLVRRSEVVFQFPRQR